MALNLGTVKPGSTIYIPFNTFDSNDPSASVAIASFVAGDIEVYKDGSVTQRASDSGYTLLDTDGIDFDSHVGIGGFSIDLADNSTAGFWASGSRYFVVVGPATVDAATVNFVAATFDIGYPDAILNTTIATLASQVSFTLTSGPADDDALNGCVCLVHDVASAVQIALGYVSDYTGSTKTVTLAADPGIFTAVATDNVSFLIPANVMAVGGTAQTAGDIIADTNDLQTQIGTAGAGLTDLGGMSTGMKAQVNTEADTALTDYDAPTKVEMDTLIGSPAGASVSADIAAIEAQTDDIGVAGAGLTAVPWNAAWDAEVESEATDALVAMFTDAATLVNLFWDETMTETGGPPAVTASFW